MRVGGRRGAAGIAAAAAGAAAEGRSEAVKAAVYAAIDRVGRGAIAAELRGDAGAGRGSGGPVDRAVRIAAGSAGLPGLRGGGGADGADGAGGAGGGDAAAALTALLHYMLSAASVPSQRRVAVRGEEIDIVVPDVAGLPAAVAVCIVGEAGGDRAEARAAAAAAALGLPRGSVWVAGWSRAAAPDADAASGGREYLASDASLALLVRDLAAFAASPAAAGGGGGGRGRRLGLLGNAAGA